MADISKIKKKSTQTEYNIKDSSARSSISTIEGKIPSSASASNKLATASDVSDIETELVNGEVKTQSITFTAYEGYVLYGNQNEGFSIRAASLPNGLCYLAEVEKDTLYKVSKEGGNRFRIVGFVNEPVIPSTVLDPLTYEFIEDNNAEEYIINSSRYSYIAFTVNSNDSYSNIDANIGKCELKVSTSRRAEQSILGSKNLLNNVASNMSENGISFEVYDDGSFCPIGDATADAVLKLTDNISTKLEEGQKYILSGNWRNRANAETYLYIRYVENSETKYITLEENAEVGFVYEGWDSFSINFIVKNGTTGLNRSYIIRPMLRLSTDEDNTFAPFARTNRELTEKSFSKEEQLILSSKNFLENKGTGDTINNVTFTVNDDQSVTITGIPSQATSFLLHEQTYKWLPEGNYIISDKNHTADIYTFLNRKKTTAGSPNYVDSKSGRFTVDYEEYDYYSCSIYITENMVGQSIDVTLYPMIRLAIDKDDTYAPYAMTNKELTDSKADLDSNGKIPSSELPIASTSSLGAIKPDGTSITVDANGVASASGGGGGGTTVVPNPSGTATGDLTKVQIGNDIYGIHDTTYSVTSKTAAGLAPQLPNETATTKYLRQDGSWVVPPDTTYSDATTAVHGLMSAADKTLLGKVFQMRDVISSASYDLNNAKSNGMYFINGVKCQNFPTGLLNSGEDGSTFKHSVIVFRIDVANTYGQTIQLCYRGTTGKLAIRVQYASSGNWENWKYITFS